MHPQISSAFEVEMNTLLSEFQEANPLDGRVEWTVTRSGWSSMKDYLVERVARGTPDLLAVEDLSELDDLPELTPKPPAKKEVDALFQGLTPFLVKQSRDRSGRILSIPFLRISPILVINNDWIAKFPPSLRRTSDNWGRWMLQLKTLSEQANLPKVLTFSLLGEEGLWLIETLLKSPFWNSRGESLPGTAAQWSDFQSFLENAGYLVTHLSAEESLEQFKNEKVPFLVTFSHHLPQLQRDLKFSWRFQRLPLNPKQSLVSSGTQWLLLKPSESAYRFLQFLYSPKVAVRWIVAAGAYPLKSAWLKSDEWRNFKSEQPLLAYENLGSPQLRHTVRERYRVRSRWIQGLPELFGDRNLRKPAQTVIKAIDTHP